MNILNHFIVGLVLSVLLLPFFGIYSFFLLISSFLLDLDHYLLFVLKTRKFSIKESVDYYKREGCGRHHLFVFHTIEFLVLLGILAFFSKIFLVLFIGGFVHLFIDYLDWFLWVSYYSERVPSILLAPIVFKRDGWLKKKKLKT